MSVKIWVPVSDEFISDILITAFDAKYGGCLYWADVRDVRGNTKNVPAAEFDDEVLITWSEVIVDVRLELIRSMSIRAISMSINRRTIEAGLQKLAKIDDKILEAVTSLDAGMIDSAMADEIVQYGRFDGKIYG